MEGVWQVLGYKALMGDISDHFDMSGRVAIVEGPPGVGKSWLTKGIGADWEANGGTAVVAEGDIGRSYLDYYPFSLALAGLPAGWDKVGSAAAGAAQAAEVLLGTGGLVTNLLRGLARLRKGRRTRRAIYLGEREQEILADLERMGAKKPILLIADNLHWWDAASLHLLCELAEPNTQDAYPFLSDLRILAAQTPEPYQATSHPDVLRNVISRNSIRRIKLDRIPEDTFGDVLEALGASPPPDNALTSALYALSGGHLALASRVAIRISAGEMSEIAAVRDSHEFTKSLIDERMTSLGDFGQRAISLLQVAAVLGLAFRRDEILCAIDDDERATTQLLRLCRDERLLDLSDGNCRFVHDLYREFFLSRGEANRIAIHERLHDCLRLLRSGDYDLRSQNAHYAEKVTVAAALGAMACLQAVRDGKSWHAVSPTTLANVRDSGFRPIVATFVQAIEKLHSYEYGACLATLDSLPRDLPKMLLAEADGIRAMCLMSTRSEEDRERGRSILSGWDGYEDDEPELGIRLSRLLLYGLTHAEDKSAGRQLEVRIRQHLIERVSIDQSALDNLFVLDRCAASLYEPEVAVVRNAQAVDHFAPPTALSIVRKPLEYYRSLVNYGAGLTANARYAEALEVYDLVRKLVDQFPEGTFPRVDYPLSNEVAVRVRAGVDKPEDALREQRRIIREHGVESDPFYVYNAVGVYLALSGRAEEAVEVYDWLLSELHRNRVIPESSTVYLLRANRCCAMRVVGLQSLRAEWDSLFEIVNDIRYVIRTYLRRRHELLATAFDDDRPITAERLDGYVERIAPDEFGPLWKNYNRGFRLTEVEFWREN